jgi:hypothetical protein
VTAWMLRTIGIGGELTQQVDELSWMAARPIWLWLAIIGAPILLWLISLRHRASLSHIRPWARHALTACRVGFFVLLMVVLAGPYVRLHQQVTSKPILAVVIDESASMRLPAGPFESSQIEAMAKAAGLMPRTGDAEIDRADLRRKLNDMTRGQLLRDVLSSQHDTLVAPLADRFDVVQYRVATGVRKVEGRFAPQPLAEDQTQDTALGVALRQVIDDAAGRPIAGIVLLTDGRTTTGTDPMSVVRGVTASNAIQAPVWAVPIGSDTSPGADIAVLDVLFPQRVSAKDTIHVIATIGSNGLAGRQVQVRLVENEQVLDTATLVLDERPSQQVTLSCDAPEAGVRLLSVEIDPQPEEIVTDNNKAQASIEVDAQTRKVLYLEGYPRWDYRFLDHELRRDHGLEVTLVMESALTDSGVKAENLPARAQLPEDADGFAKYDVVVLGDVSPALLPTRLMEQLAIAVEDKGVGLLVQAGFTHMPHRHTGDASAPLARLLPVSVEAGASQGGLDAEVFSPFRMSVTASGAIHPAFRLYPSAERNRTVWSQMPTFYWAAATNDAKPAATVLGEIEHQGRTRPLIVEHWAGRGRVLFIGVDSTYRWRRNIGSALFGRFWNQALRHVARSDQRDGDQTLLLASPARVETGEPVGIELFLADQDRRTAPGDDLIITVVGPDDATERVTLRAAGDSGYFSGVWRAKGQGSFDLSYRGARETVNTRVVVTASGREHVQPTVDRPGLRALASASGGALIELEGLHELPDRLEGEATTLSRVVEDEVWDNWFTLMLLAGIYCVDVGIRRLHGLT